MGATFAASGDGFSKDLYVGHGSVLETQLKGHFQTTGQPTSVEAC